MSKPPRTIILIFLALILFGHLQAQTKVFSSAKGSGENQAYYEFDKWNFSINKDEYEISKNGKGKRTSEEHIVTRFPLRLEKNEYLERVVYFAEYKNDLLLLCESGEGDYGAGFITRLDGKTLKPKWQGHIPAFSVARGIIEGRSAYLAALGFIAKIDLETGKYLWKHENFYRKYKESGAFNVFEVPVIERNRIVFKENQDEYGRPPNTIKLNKNNGKIIEVSVN
jgi:hypothetical protein